MRILHLVNEVVDTGNGIVNVTVDLAATQAGRGDEVMVASAGGGYEDLLVRHGVPHVRIDFRGRPLSAAPALRALLARFRPEVVHAHTVAPCALAAGLRRVPGVADFALVATMHNVYQRSSALMATADLTVGVAESVTEVVRARRWRSTLVETVVNGVVASPRRNPVGPVPAPGAPVLGPRSIVALGAVSHRKGADVLLAAFAQVARTRPDVHLWYVGNPDWDEHVRRVRDSPLADRVHLPGQSPDPGAYLSAATVVAVPSRREGLPLSLLEARQYGAAIVATETDGAREGLDGGAAGILVPVEDVGALADALARVLDDPGHRAELSRRAAADLERFTVSRMARDYRDRYAAALELRGAIGAREAI